MSSDLGESALGEGKRMRVFSYSTEDGERIPLLETTSRRYWIPKRYIFSFFAFTACSLAVSFNMNLSIAIVPMVNRTEDGPAVINASELIIYNGSRISLAKVGELRWGAEMQGIILGAVYFGQLVSFIPGGRMAELYGGKRMLLLCTLFSSVSTILLPVVAELSPYAFIVGRFLVGLGTGPIIPIVFYLMARWIPVAERSFHASFILSGYGVGSFLAVIISGALCGSDFLGGWPSVYYTGGVCGCVWTFLAWSVTYETPDDHPTISLEEISYIINGLETEKPTQIKHIPWKEMIISVPLWALAFGFFGQFWLLGFFSTIHAVYMGTVLDLPIVKNGELSCLPHLLRAIATCAASFPVDFILRRKLVSVGFVRKGATVINTVVSCAAFLGITYVGRNETATTLLFILGGILGEFVTFGVCMACMDLAPSLSGTVSGLINIVGVFPFFIIPALAGWMTHYERSILKWRKVFYVTIAVASVTTLIFVVFGDLRPQAWGSAPERKSRNKSEEDSEQNSEETPTIPKNPIDL